MSFRPLSRNPLPFYPLDSEFPQNDRFENYRIPAFVGMIYQQMSFPTPIGNRPDQGEIPAYAGITCRAPIHPYD